MLKEDPGNSKTLPRSLGPTLAVALVISNVIGVGIFTTSGLLARNLADPVLLLGIWVLGGLLALVGALCYAELGAQFPRAGGEYAYLREAYGPLVSFLSGWASLFAGFSAPVAAAAVGFTEYLSAYFPSLSTQDPAASGESLLLPGHFVAVLVIILLSVLHYRKVQVGGGVHIGLTAFKAGIILVFVLAGFSLGEGDTGRFAQAIPFSDWPPLMPAVAGGLIFVMFSYSGWNAAAYIGGELREPQRNIPLSLITGTVFVVVMYVAINALYIYALPFSQMASVIRIAEQASSGLFGLSVAPFINLIFMGTILSSISAMIIAGPRVYFAMAHDGVFPGGIARVHARFGTPGNAIVLQAVWSIVLLFTGRFEQLLTFSGVVLILFSSLTVGAVYVIRRRTGTERRPYSCWGYPFTPLLFLAASAWILLVCFRDQPRESLSGLAVVASGVPFYYFWMWKKRRASAQA